MAEGRGVLLRRRLATLFDDEAPHTRLREVFDVGLAALIVLNVGAVVLESVEPLHLRFAALFDAIEHAATAFFAAEYMLRLWTAVDLSGGRYRAPLLGRLRYMRGFFAIIDLISVLPAALGLIGAGDLRTLRLLRLLRMLKLTRRSHVFGLLWAVVRQEAQAIAALLFILGLVLTVSGSLMYMIEGDVQPTVFASIPAAMWWAIETLTTVGYGDMVPETVVGKMLAGLVSIAGIGTLALFSGLITVSFLDQLRIRRDQAARSASPVGQGASACCCPHCGRAIEEMRAPISIIPAGAPSAIVPRRAN
jgi:voltage-gated potassium channel